MVQLADQLQLHEAMEQLPERAVSHGPRHGTGAVSNPLFVSRLAMIGFVLPACPPAINSNNLRQLQRQKAIRLGAQCMSIQAVKTLYCWPKQRKIPGTIMCDMTEQVLTCQLSR